MDDHAEDVFRDREGFPEVFLGKGAGVLGGGFSLVRLRGAGIELAEELVALDGDRCARAVCTTRIICNVFAETDCFDGVAGKVTSTDK